jgi:hypothetical protein
MDPCPLQTPEEVVQLEKRESVGGLMRRLNGLVPIFEGGGGAKGGAEGGREGGGNRGVPPMFGGRESVFGETSVLP